MGDHPFIVELRLPWYPEHPSLSGSTQNRRAWELQLILNLVLNHVLRFGPRIGDHSWVLLDDEGGPVEARFLQPGYTIPKWTYQTTDFTPTDGISPIPEMPDDDYRSHRGFDDAFVIPAVLRPLLDQYHAVPPEIRDRFLHACYWYERSGAAWSMSVSLGHIAAVTAIETLMNPSTAKPCPECGLDTSPGPTRRYRAFLERYAPTIPNKDRKTVYRLRSALVHKGQPLDIDVPGPWGSLVPRDIKDRDTHASARRAAREAIINWLLVQ